MFNQLTPTDVVTAIGVAARDNARGGERLDAFARDQLMSVYSATRHLAAELQHAEAELARFTAAVARRLREAGGHDETAAILEHGTDVARVGTGLADLLAALRVDASPAATRLRIDLHGLLRELADREVDFMAEGLT